MGLRRIAAVVGSPQYIQRIRAAGSHHIPSAGSNDYSHARIVGDRQGHLHLPQQDAGLVRHRLHGWSTVPRCSRQCRGLTKASMASTPRIQPKAPGVLAMIGNFDDLPRHRFSFARWDVFSGGAWAWTASTPMARCIGSPAGSPYTTFPSGAFATLPYHLHPSGRRTPTAPGERRYALMTHPGYLLTFQRPSPKELIRRCRAARSTTLAGDRRMNNGWARRPSRRLRRRRGPLLHLSPSAPCPVPRDRAQPVHRRELMTLASQSDDCGLSALPTTPNPRAVAITPELPARDPETTTRLTGDVDRSSTNHDTRSRRKRPRPASRGTFSLPSHPDPCWRPRTAPPRGAY